ncbi:histidine phosphatase family protein [uncultured Limosilactobacillus sp.]|uniref:histidine phosphatase family protein n=1 Tax=uncultured Limosilactobacillus sp. TaxID=2837629 RepID=UPI0025CE8132|nr:histidine phosphatase family protein [uncultured Limosilactobacillus sp.]
MSEYHIFMVRHGQTFLNTFHRLQGWIDSGLTNLGQQQAVETGHRLQSKKFDLVVSSDLNRAIQTRDLIVEQLSQSSVTTKTDSSFREVFFSAFEGLPADLVFQKIAQHYGFIDQDDIIAKKGFAFVRQLMRDDDPTHQAELYSDIISRFRTGLVHITQTLPHGGNVLIISHGAFIRTIADYLGVNVINNFPNNAGITELAMSLPSNIRMVAYNCDQLS